MTPSLQTYMTATRRALHKIPEGGWEEHKTQAYLLQSLADCPGWQISQPCGTAIKAVYAVPGATKTLAFRADMDALSLPEQTGLPFASEHPGYMHACGHDGHMAVALGIARAVCDGEIKPTCNLVLLFQPAEESIGGADQMIAAGVLENPHVDEIYGLHLHPCVSLGQVGLREGPLMAATREFVAEITGAASHGALPHLGRDALLAAATFALEAQSIPARDIDPMQPALVTIGQLNAGHRRNIVADAAHIEGITRSFDAQVDAAIFARLEQILDAACKMHRVDYTLETPTYYPPLVNAPAPTARLRAAAGDRAVAVKPQLTAEDFSFFANARPAAYCFVGVGAPGGHALHHGKFDFDESALGIALGVFANLITSYEEA